MKGPKQVTIEEHEYLIGRLDAVEQLHVSRKIIPMIGAIQKHFREGGGSSGVEIFVAMGDVFAGMKQEDVDYVLRLCLKGCRRKVGDKQWASVLMDDPSRIRLTHELDTDMPELMQLVFSVMSENLGNFFGGPPSISPSEPGPTSN